MSPETFAGNPYTPAGPWIVKVRESFTLEKISSDSEKYLFMKSLLAGSAAYWFAREAGPTIEHLRKEARDQFSATETLITLLTTKFGGELSWLQQKRLITAVPFRDVLLFCDDFMSTAAKCPDMTLRDLAFDFTARLTPTDRHMISDSLISDGKISDIIAIIKKKAKERAEDLAAEASSTRERTNSRMKLEHLSASSLTSSKLFHIPATLARRKCQVLLDCGASTSFISAKLVDKGHFTTAPCSQSTILLADGSTQTSGRTCTAELSMLGTTEKIVFLVMDTAHDVILGLPWFRHRNPTIDWISGKVTLNPQSAPTTPMQENPQTGTAPRIELISAIELRTFSEEDEFCLLNVQFRGPQEETQPTQAQSPDFNPKAAGLVREFADVFEEPTGIPKGTPKHSIKLEGSMDSRVTYRMSTAELDELKRQLAELTNKGWVRPSKSAFASPVIFVKKKDGSLRLCVDYRRLNAVTVKDRYPLPRIDSILDRLGGSTIFSKLDLKSGYNQIPIEEADIPKTAFSTNFGLFEFTVMPFGLCNAPATFMRVMNDALAPHIDKFVQVFLDDILIYSKDEQEHRAHLKTILDSLRKHSLKASLKKCAFFEKEVSFLGHVVSAGGVATDPDKVSAVKSWPTPANVKELRSFLGLAGYYQKFIKNYASLSAPLSDLLKSDIEFIWKSEHTKCFELLKAALTTAPVLHIPDPHKDFTLETDASGYAIGAVLSQKDKHGNLRPITFVSRKMDVHERRYATHEQETLAIIYALRKLRHHLHGPKVTVLTDHHSIQYLSTQAELSGRQARWVATLADFNLDIKYRPGKDNPVADALSRSPEYLTLVTIDLDASFKRKIVTAYTKDPDFGAFYDALVTKTQKPDNKIASLLPRYFLHEDLLFIRADGNRLCVPNGQRLQILNDHHDAPAAGHPGYDKTLVSLRRLFYWPKMAKSVETYVASCHACQRNKPRTHTAPGLLHPLQIPDAPWRAWSMDWITKLPLTPQGHDSILVVVDRLSKMAHFLPVKGTDTAADTAAHLVNNVIRVRGIPASIVSDRDPKLVSKYWQSICKLLGIKSLMSTAFHPETDGQTERMNRTLEQYLRHYVTYDQKNWEDLLPMAEFAYNSAQHSSTGLSPFEVGQGVQPTLFPSLETSEPIKGTSDAAKTFVQQASSNVARARDALEKAQQSQAAQANKTRVPSNFKIGDQVMVSTENIRPDTLGRAKLTNRFVGPFKITRSTGGDSFELQLPADMKIHPVFHSSLLKPFVPNPKEFTDREPPVRHPVLVDGSPEYVVEKILDHKALRSGTLYKVLWKGYPEEDATWEPEENLTNAPQLLKQYQQRS